MISICLEQTHDFWQNSQNILTSDTFSLSSEQFKDYFKTYGCMPPLPPLPPGYSYDKGEKGSGRRTKSRSRSPRRYRYLYIQTGCK